MNSASTSESESVAPTGFMVLHGNRLEDLRDLLVQFMAANPLGPLEPEVILLQSNGMKHWLELALADDSALGICAATRMELPSAYLWQMYRAVLGADAVPAHMPFDKVALLWRLVRLLPTLCQANPVYAPLKRYLAGHSPARKLYQLALQLADVLDGYQSYRFDWLADWAGGRDKLQSTRGAPTALPPEYGWQAQLWRDLRSDVGPALAESSRASVHERFMRALEALNCSEGERIKHPSGLPQRLIVFGVSSLPMQAVQALAGLGQVCQVLMLVQNPCQYYWGDIVPGHDQLRQQLHRRQQAKPSPIDEPASVGHALLASWGKQGRDYLHLLDGFDQPEKYRAHWSRVDLFVDPALDTLAAGAAKPSQLAQLQSAILNLSATPPAPQLQADDGSISFVSAHSAQRELEVLHDRLLAWFEADPALQPRQVMVMVPDMPAFAPHIQAVFGRFTPGQTRFIPFSVADTTARQSPLVQALEALLNLPTARLSLADWLALFEVPALRARFDLDEAGVQQLQSWLSVAGVRWGLDGAQRLTFGLPATAEGLGQNTWAFGLRRLLLGYAVGAGEVWADVLPQSALSGLDAKLAAGLLDWLEAIEQTLPTLQSDQTPTQWGQTLRALVGRFFAGVDDSDERAIARLLEPLELWLQRCDEAQLDSVLPLEVVREHWLSQISEAGLQQRFFGGGVQFGTLMPMRSIPFKVICLLGMNDGAYPRVPAARDFDLMAGSWRAGDRSRREDDRYLFLEALLSARQQLYVSWQGRSASDNSQRPPSVLVAQLLDHVNACWSPPRAAQAQPLQPFSKAYFEAGSGFQTFAVDWQAMGPEPLLEEASLVTEVEAPRCLMTPPDGLTLEHLQRLLRQPVEVFFRHRLQVQFDSLEELEQEDEPFALNALQAYQSGAVLLQSGCDEPALARLRGGGELPLAGFGQKAALELIDKAQTVLQAQARWLKRYPESLAAQAVDLALDQGVTLSGTLADLHGQGGGATASPCLQLAARTGAVLQGRGESARGHVLVGLWLRHLAACASGLTVTSVQLGVDGQVLLRPLAPEAALAVLQRLAQAYAQAWGSPLPLACKSAWAYLLAEQNNQGLRAVGKPAKDAHEAARLAFEGGQRGGERAESAYLQRSFDGYDDIADDLPHWAQELYGDLLACIDLSQEMPP